MSDSNSEAMRRLALGLVAAGEAGRHDEMKSYFAPEATSWHNTDAIARGVADNRALYATFAERVRNRRYVDIEIFPIEGGYVQRHRLLGDITSGGAFDLHACMIMRVENGKIVRTNEYFDSAPFLKAGLRTWLP